jgi:hypothetical protein
MDLNRTGRSLLCLAGFILALGPAWADQEELQVGYVYDSWSSNSLYHGTENRVPMGYYFSIPNLTLSLNTAFVAGDYVEDADPTYDIQGSEYKSSQFTDMVLGANWAIDMGNSVKSNIYGTLNIPTGDQSWELNAQSSGAIPYIFEPSYYHGAGWGGTAFYTLSVNRSDLSYGAGFGFMSTAIYDTGISSEGTYSPGNNVAALATLGFRMSPADTWGFRYVHTFAVESTYANAYDDFTEGDGNILTSQWISQMGKDKLVVNVSYSVYEAGNTAETIAPYTLQTDPGPYFGNRLEVHPVLGYQVGPGVSMESGLLWDWIQPNGYSQSSGDYQGGGNLLGAEQSITFQIDPGTFWNVAGLYHYIDNYNAGLGNQGTINYERFSLGTNVGVKW